MGEGIISKGGWKSLEFPNGIDPKLVSSNFEGLRFLTPGIGVQSKLTAQCLSLPRSVGLGPWSDGGIMMMGSNIDVCLL